MKGGKPAFALVFLSFTLLGALFHFPHFNNPFLHDDNLSILKNPSIRSFENLPRLISDTIAYIPEVNNDLYRPLVSISLALNYLISGLDSWSYRLFNLLIIARKATLLVLIMRKWKATRGSAFLAGASGIGCVIYQLILNQNTKKLKSNLIEAAGHLVSEEYVSNMSRKELKEFRKKLPPEIRYQLSSQS